jgi:TolA-binding protein
MVSFRRWFLIALALLLGGGPLLAAQREDRSYAAAALAFHDKFYSLAETKLNQYLQTYRKSTNAPAALLLLARTEYCLKKYGAVTNRLGDPVNLAKAKAAGLADGYDYWRAEAQFAQGDLAGAAETFVSVAENYPNSPLALGAVVEAAAAFGENANWSQVDDLLDSPNGLFQRRAHLDAANGQVVDGRLLQAESKCAQQNFAGALQVLNLLDPPTLTPQQDWKRARLAYRADLGRNDLEAALAAATNLMQIARFGHGDLWATNLAESVACRAGVFEQQGRWALASDAWRENLTNNIPDDQQRRAILKVADLAIIQGKLGEAETNLQSFWTKFPDSPAAGIALLTLGELHLKDFIARPAGTNHLVAAEEYLADSTNGPLAGKAYLDHGWCNWLEAAAAQRAGDASAAAAKVADSLDDFKAAAQALPRESEDLAVATFKTGDAQFALTNYPDAIASYRQVLTGFPALTNVSASLGASALYQILRGQLALQDTNGMDDTMGQLLAKFFGAPATASSLLLAGQGFSDFGDPAKARELFERFERERTNSPLLPQAAFALARTYAREQNWPATVSHCEAWLQSFPASEFKPQVEYILAWAVAQAGDEPRSFQLFTNFVSQYPSNPSLTPLARWAVADHYFRLGTNFTAAEFQYQSISESFPTNDLAEPAQLMAARAAMGRFSYSEAIRYVKPIIENSNAPAELQNQARFAYCEAARGMTSETNTLSLLEATNILGEMYVETPTNIAGALAWCETGDCNLQLGAFDSATNAYAQVLAAPSASVELRCRAQVGLGIALEKKADGQPPVVQRTLRTQALNNYLAVIYTTNDAADPFWMKKAALQALQLMPLVKEGEINDFIGRLEHWLPQLTDLLEKKRAALGKG